MTTKDYFLIGIAILGWFWAIIQFILNRRYQKSDKALEKRFEVYSNFMNKVDEMSTSMRTDPQMIYGIQTELMAELISGDEERTNNALLKFNESLIEFTRTSLQPMMIVNQELNKLKLVASEKLHPLISEYKFLVDDFSNEYKIMLNNLSFSNDINETARILESMGHEERAEKFKGLWEVIEKLMRDEIDYYKK